MEIPQLNHELKTIVKDKMLIINNNSEMLYWVAILTITYIYSLGGWFIFKNLREEWRTLNNRKR